MNITTGNNRVGSPAEPDDLLTTSDAAKMMPGDVTAQTLVRWAKAGHIRYVQLVPNGRLYVLRTEIEAMMTPRFEPASLPDASR